ncbi:MAG TPA: murein L,D-transpeptidase catalytic domain family protein [Candidatus Polarisedimenticolaceae bacterium]|nr:murein L,D-transpeptidase catalytic domain family protein [Candidatus Polarisedimenticolaceae bacterium]
MRKLLVVSVLAFGAATAKAGDLESTLQSEAQGLHPAALHAALVSWESLHAKGEALRPLLAVIDYALPSTEKRLWVFDLTSQKLLFHDLVAHGRNSGDDLAEWFSNQDGSYMSSLGAFVTGEAYEGHNGYSMRLRGADPSINDRAEARAIVLHGAPYVDEGVAATLGRLGRSLGCPAVRPSIAHELIDQLKDGGVIYAWHPSLGH